MLDIEGTIAPISFVTDTLFPYAREHLQEHLESTYESKETQADIAKLREEVSLYSPLFVGLCMHACPVSGYLTCYDYSGI